MQWWEWIVIIVFGFIGITGTVAICAICFMFWKELVVIPIVDWFDRWQHIRTLNKHDKLWGRGKYKK